MRVVLIQCFCETKPSKILIKIFFMKLINVLHSAERCGDRHLFE